MRPRNCNFFRSRIKWIVRNLKRMGSPKGREGGAVQLGGGRREAEDNLREWSELRFRGSEEQLRDTIRSYREVRAVVKQSFMELVGTEWPASTPTSVSAASSNSCIGA